MNIQRSPFQTQTTDGYSETPELRRIEDLRNYPRRPIGSRKLFAALGVGVVLGLMAGAGLAVTLIRLQEERDPYQKRVQAKVDASSIMVMEGLVRGLRRERERNEALRAAQSQQVADSVLDQSRLVRPSSVSVD